MLRTMPLAAMTVKNMCMDVANKQFNGLVEPPKPIAFLTDSDQQESRIRKFQGKIQAIAFDQDIYRVWAYNTRDFTK